MSSHLQMHELVQGSGVFIFKAQLALCWNAPSRTSLACRLLRVFFTPGELAEGRLGKRVSTKYAHLKLLDQRIITAIKGKLVPQNGHLFLLVLIYFTCSNVSDASEY